MVPTVLLLFSACHCTGTDAVIYGNTPRYGTGIGIIPVPVPISINSVLFRLESVQIIFVNLRVLASRYIYIACMELNY
jgi:hypothetical protein